MSEGTKQTVMLEVQDRESARILCETLSMNGYITKAEKNKENVRGTWLVFVEVKEVEK